eukprot:4640642-Amphidinium_carterae.1
MQFLWALLWVPRTIRLCIRHQWLCLATWPKEERMKKIKEIKNSMTYTRTTLKDPMPERTMFGTKFARDQALRCRKLCMPLNI